MLNDYLNLKFEVKGETLKGFCVKINDEFHETYAVILEGYQSFAIWLDKSSSNWCASKKTNVDASILAQIFAILPKQTVC